ncbi:reverse transcriptase domain-containing protein [Tanacetum coccineum]
MTRPASPPIEAQNYLHTATDRDTPSGRYPYTPSQLALVDGKKILVIEAFVRRDLQLNDKEGTDCLPNATIFEELTRMGTMESTIIYLATNQKFNFSKYIFESMVKNLDNAGKFLMYPRKPKRKDTEVPQPSGPITNVADEAVNEEMDDSLVRAATTGSSLEAEQDSGFNTPQSDEYSMKIKELIEFCTKLQQRVLDLENTKSAQAQEITSLKLRVKKLEKKGGSRTGMKRISDKRTKNEAKNDKTEHGMEEREKDKVNYKKSRAVIVGIGEQERLMAKIALGFYLTQETHMLEALSEETQEGAQDLRTLTSWEAYKVGYKLFESLLSCPNAWTLCMRTRSSSNLVGDSSSNPTTTNPKRRNRRRSKQPFSSEESPIATMVDQRTMVELLRAPTEGYAEAIVVPPILAEHFELKPSLINMMTSDQFFGLEKDNPHDRIRWFNKITSIIKYKDVPNSAIKLMLFPFSLAGAARRWLEKEPPRSILTWEDLVSKFINEFFPPSRMTNLRNEISNFQQKFDESFHEAWDHYKDLLRACHDYGFTELHQLDTFYNALNPTDQDSLNSAAGGNLLERSTQYVLTIIKNKSKVRNSRNKSIISQVKSSDVNSSSSSDLAKLTHAVNQQREGCRLPTALTGLFFNKINILNAILKQFQATPPPAFIKAVEEIYVTCGGAHPYYQCLIADGNTFPEYQDNIQGYVAAAAGNYKIREELILRDGNERLTLNMRHDTSSYSTQPHQESINMMSLNASHEEILKDFLPSLHFLSLTLTSHHTDLTSPKVNDDIFDPEGDIIENLLNLDKTKDLPPYHDNPLSGSTTSSSPSLPISETSDYFLEEFADELAHFAFPPGIDYLPFDIKSDLREIEYLLNHDPIKEMDSILEDSVDKNSPDDNLVDTISEMFTDEHALDYSSPPLWDDYDDELFDLETVNDNTYDDPFDSKEEKIKDSKILIDELDPPGSSDFLPFPECDSVFYEDFSKVDALPSTNNEDKVFNPGILIHENLYEVTNLATMEKNVKKTTNASLILEDFNPPLYELPFHKEVLRLGALLSFSSENEEKVFNPGILTSKGIHTSLLPELSYRGLKAFKDFLDFEASRARSFYPSFTRASNPQLHFRSEVPILVSVGCQKPGHLAARLGCAETKFATWDDLAFKLIILGWNPKPCSPSPVTFSPSFTVPLTPNPSPSQTPHSHGYLPCWQSHKTSLVEGKLQEIKGYGCRDWNARKIDGQALGFYLTQETHMLEALSEETQEGAQDLRTLSIKIGLE